MYSTYVWQAVLLYKQSVHHMAAVLLYMQRVYITWQAVLLYKHIVKRGIEW